MSDQPECYICADHARVQALIERSSLGSAEAKAVRESVPNEVGIAIARAAEYLGRAERAEATVARVRKIYDMWMAWDGSQGPDGRIHPDASSPRDRERLRAAPDPEAGR